MANKFGITVDDIRAVHNLSIRTDTTPSTSDVEQEIEYYTALVTGEAEASGIETDGLSSTSVDYYVLKKMVLYGVISQVLLMRNKPDNSQVYLDRYNELRQTIRTRPQAMDTDDVGPGSFQRTLNTDGRDILIPGPLGALARRGW